MSKPPPAPTPEPPVDTFEPTADTFEPTADTREAYERLEKVRAMVRETYRRSIARRAYPENPVACSAPTPRVCNVPPAFAPRELLRLRRLGVLLLSWIAEEEVAFEAERARLVVQRHRDAKKAAKP